MVAMSGLERSEYFMNIEARLLGKSFLIDVEGLQLDLKTFFVMKAKELVFQSQKIIEIQFSIFKKVKNTFKNCRRFVETVCKSCGKDKFYKSNNFEIRFNCISAWTQYHSFSQTLLSALSVRTFRNFDILS